MREDRGHPDLATQFEQFGRWVARDGDGPYPAICRRVAADPSLLALFDGTPPAQQRPHLLLAAVHYLLLGGADHPLAARYDTVVRRRGLVAHRGGSDEATGDAFADFCLRWRPELEALVAERATQTNEIGRCAALLPALATVARHTGRPLSLIDLGASAGLNLLFDHYAYTYTYTSASGAGTALTAGDPQSPVEVRCELRGPALPPLGTPPIAFRTGIDLRPIDPTASDQARWLLACGWPHDLDRFERLAAALALAAALPAADRPRVWPADLVDGLEERAADAPADSDLVVFHSWVAAYLTPTEQASLGHAVARLARQRPVWWVFAESPFEVPALPIEPSPGPEADRSATALMLIHLQRADRQARRLADMHYHGTWLRWLG